MNRRLRRISLFVGVVAAIVVLIALGLRAPAAPSAWLFAWFYFLGLPLGSLVILSLHGLTGGHWGLPLRPVLMAATRTFPWLIPLGFPVLLSFQHLYPWARADGENHAPWYLNQPFFLARLAIYFIVWFFLTRRLSLAESRSAAAAVVVHVIMITFAAVDLVMSLQPGWYSTTFGLLIGVAQTLSALAFCAVALNWFSPSGESQDFHDLGNLILVFIMLWAYIAFSQYLIIWYTNIPREVAWYLPRIQGVWGGVAVSLILFQLTLPFALLLFRTTKRHLPRLAALGALLLLSRVFESYWTIIPSVRTNPSWLDPLAVIGIGGLWLGAFLFHLDRTAEAAHG